MRNIRLLCLIVICLFILPQSTMAADFAFVLGEKHWRITLSQRALADLGYPVDRKDGVFTKATATALEKFQQKNQLSVTKNIDKTTYSLLMSLQKKARTTPITPVISTKSTTNKPQLTPPKPAKYKKTKVIAAPTPGSPLADKILNTAGKYKGTPYAFGGTGRRGVDCSGYIQLVFREHGINLPRTADVQYTIGKVLRKKDLQKGDLVFFSTYESGPSHVGIYDGKGMFWHASSSRGVMSSSLNDPYYWGPRYIGARRVLS